MKFLKFLNIILHFIDSTYVHVYGDSYNVVMILFNYIWGRKFPAAKHFAQTWAWRGRGCTNTRATEWGLHTACVGPQTPNFRPTVSGADFYHLFLKFEFMCLLPLLEWKFRQCLNLSLFVYCLFPSSY